MKPNYSYLYNNLSPERKKYTNIYRSLSPVVIKTYGVNNFVYERKYKTKTNNDIYDSEYDYIERDIKNSKGVKGQITYTELSTQENMSLFSSQRHKPIKRNINNYINNYSNINNEGDYYIYSGNENSFLKERNDNKTKTYIGDNNSYRYKIFNKEEIGQLFYPNEKISNNENYRNYKQKKKKTELISQSFSTSIIPEKKIEKICKKNNIFEIKYNKNKKRYPNKEIEIKKQNHSYTNIKRESSFSKSRINLQDFNIDKLNEIGDNYALNLLSKNNNTKIKNNINKTNLNNENIFPKKENEFIKNLIIIKEKRNSSNKKEDSLLQSNNDINSQQKKIYVIDNKNKIKTPNIHDIINLNIKSNGRKNKIKIINIDKKNIGDLKEQFPPKVIKIKLKDKILRNKWDYYINNSDNRGRKIIYYNNIKKINNINERNINNHYSPNKIQKSRKTPDKKKVSKSPNRINDNKYNNNQMINLNCKYKNLNLNYINHCYLESININKTSKASKTKHSFNNIFLPP